MSAAVLNALTPDRWVRVNQELLAKAVSELSYEGVIEPDVSEEGQLRWHTPAGTVTGWARQRVLGGWRVEPDTLEWSSRTRQPESSGVDLPERTGVDLPDATAVLSAVLTEAGVDPSTVAQFVGELSATLVSDSILLACARPAKELIDTEPVLVESELRGHPWIIANKGRVGFNAGDLAAYPPEARQDVRLHWLAAAPGIADVRGLEHHTVVREQVGDAEFGRMQATAAGAGLDPETCIYLPVHPWQWTNRILPLHAGDLASGGLVHLGEGPARYRPQLAIRTLTDLDLPERRYLKLPLSVLNTSVYRGLPRERTIAAPALTGWLSSVVAADPFLVETGLVLLGEVASVSVPHRTYQALPGVPYQHTELLGAIWRESVAGYIHPGERAISLAALLHVDHDGRSFVAELVERSGLPPTEWIERLHEAVLPPLLHVLYRYGAMFSPHGQNCMLVHRDGVPTRLVVKDFVDDLALCAEPLPEHDRITPEVQAALADVVIDGKSLVKYFHGGLIVGVYRYLAEIATDHLGVPEPTFWAAARATLERYQRRFAGELAERYALFDVQLPTFPKLCLNRLRLFERGYADHAERPVIAPHGEVPNPLSAEFTPIMQKRDDTPATRLRPES